MRRETIILAVLAAPLAGACGLGIVGAAQQADVDAADAAGSGAEGGASPSDGASTSPADVDDVVDVTSPDDSGSQPESGPPPTTCNGAPCAAGNRCCFEDGTELSCRPCTSATEFKLDCRGPADCPAAMCCLDIISGVAQCEPSCGSKRTLCDPASPQICGAHACEHPSCKSGGAAPFAVCRTTNTVTIRYCSLD
jgi:hypothetical protein